MQIRKVEASDRTAVVQLWRECGLIRPWNNPERDFDRAHTTWPSLFLIGLIDGQCVASAMSGYDGHRGAVYYLAVKDKYRSMGLGRQMMVEVEKRLRNLGCPKINLCIRSTNVDVVAFYDALDYIREDTLIVSKRLKEDNSG